MFLPLFVLQRTTKGTARRFQAIAVTAVTELLGKIQLVFNPSPPGFPFRTRTPLSHRSVESPSSGHSATNSENVVGYCIGQPNAQARNGGCVSLPF